MLQCLLNYPLFRPLDEAKKVKEKFDDIFNTTRYVKCQDEIYKQIKEVRSSKYSTLFIAISSSSDLFAFTLIRYEKH